MSPVRGSRTNVELVFHTDNAFGVAPPRYVGLMCLRPAMNGGVSRFLSIYTAHERLRASHPALLERLYRPLIFDRQAEHAPHAQPCAFAPMFRFDGHRLRARMNTCLARTGYAVAGADMDAAARDALDALDAVIADNALWFELPIARGDLQYLNNEEVAHFRSHFDDHDDPALKRHLVRTWHREPGALTYDG